MGRRFSWGAGPRGMRAAGFFQASRRTRRCTRPGQGQAPQQAGNIACHSAPHAALRDAAQAGRRDLVPHLRPGAAGSHCLPRGRVGPAAIGLAPLLSQAAG
ncbi:hypothetical protein B0A89_10270 [Paracoccus contaminans]|uniref:Uncharacterized protein n=1 Tax=Paracoccus contaminans TaxID=1945662 RepID=A0A1W6CYV0_9RHOB|nr:hypothetical protein B0A89_10270 [Paracoccus contaminans]